MMCIDNIVYLPGEPKGRCASAGRFMKGVVHMVTYSDLFAFVIMLCAVVTLAITISERKK